MDVMDDSGYGLCVECFVVRANEQDGSHPIAANTDPEIKEAIIEIIQHATIEALADGTIQGILAERGYPVSMLDVRRAAAELIDEGKLEVVARKGRTRRFRLAES
jgi:hypothetical protein